jgi:hypothetical protein
MNMDQLKNMPMERNMIMETPSNGQRRRIAGAAPPLSPGAADW